MTLPETVESVSLLQSAFSGTMELYLCLGTKRPAEEEKAAPLSLLDLKRVTLLRNRDRFIFTVYRLYVIRIVIGGNQQNVGAYHVDYNIGECIFVCFCLLYLLIRRTEREVQVRQLVKKFLDLAVLQRIPLEVSENAPLKAPATTSTIPTVRIIPDRSMNTELFFISFPPYKRYARKAYGIDRRT